MACDIMWEKAKNVWNRLWNTAMMVPRTAGTILNTGTDVVDTVVEVPKRLLTVAKNTAHEIKKVFVEPWKYGKWYQRVWNIALSPFIAAWTLIEWAGKAVLTPAEWVVDTWNTAKNTVTNGWRSTFGRLFSKKPLSDFSYDKLKTSNFINKDKFRFSWLQFGKKEWVWVETPSKKAVATTAAAATAATAATAAAASTKESSTAMDDVMKKFEKKLKDMEDSFSKKMEEVLTNNKKLSEQNSALQKANTELEKKNEELKKTLEWLKKPTETKPAEKPAEKKLDEWKPGKKEDKPESKEIKDATRAPEIVKSNKWKKMLDYLQRAHPEIKIETDSSTNTWHLYWTKSWNKIVVWTKDKNEAPQVLLHEISHVLEQDNAEWVKELKDAMKALNERYGKQLFFVSNNDKYDTKEKKTIEDVCEIIALYARDDWSFDKHMKKLQSGEIKKLAKIDRSDAEHLKDLCENIISKLNVVKLHEDAPASAAA